jgi:LacI family transcriptional regulator
MKIIRKNHLVVPKDISIVGFTSGMISDLTDPELSSVEQHGYEIGREAVRLLINRIGKKDAGPARTIIVRTELVIKGSS